MTFAFDPDSLPLPRGHYIGGRYRNAPGAMEMNRPSDGAAFAESPVADAAVVDEAVAAARAALKSSGWGGLRPRERVRVLQRWADLVEAEAATLARLEAIASTRPVSHAATGDVAVTAEQIRFFAEFADKEGGDLVPTAAGQLGMILAEPYGVVGAITPWNFPIAMAGWKLGPALAGHQAFGFAHELPSK